ncbi:MAG: hypothetical protein AAFU65_06880 [Pseudomonadota bacterium]
MRQILLICLSLGAAPLALAGEWFSTTAGACAEGPTAQFGRYVGDWKITDQVLQQDGRTWADGKGARWVFQCVGEGIAVQDFWMPNGGGFGTNLRRYNTEREVWEIVWAAGPVPGLSRIEARQRDDGSLLMDILTPKSTPPRRIIFFTPDDGGWNWVQQMSFDDGTTWTDVYKIRATPWSDDLE